MCDFILATPSVLEPILLFCNSTIGVRDTRSVVMIVRVLRTLLPRFKDASPIRDYFCNDILKSCITSLHEPYFVDCQKELASLIAGTIHLDADITRDIILSLPGMDDVARVDRRLHKLKNTTKSDDRMQRSIVLDLLSGIKGVSIHEQGKIQRPLPKRKSKFEEQYMSVDEKVGVTRGGSEELVGVAGMFGGE
jgi:exportin-5